jgi:hypothetical protein
MKISKPTPAGAVLIGVILVLSLALVPAAFAGKAGGNHGGSGAGGSYSISVSTPGPYAFGEEVWTTTTAPEVAQSYIGMSCYQSGVLVATGSHANWSGGWYFNYGWFLGPSQKWTAGAATCTFTAFHLTNNKQVTDASTTIQVDG